MSGYTGRPDDESEHALILAENGIHRSQQAISGPVLTECIDCGSSIPPARVLSLQRMGMRCIRCIPCQTRADSRPAHRIRMLDRIL